MSYFHGICLPCNQYTIGSMLQPARHCPEMISFFKKFIYFIYLFLTTLGLHCCAQAFSSCNERGLLFVAVCGLLIAVASLAVEHGLQACGLQQLWHVGSVVVACGLQSTGSVVVAHRLSCSTACGIFPGPGLEPMSLALAGRFLTTAPPGKPQR